MSCQPYIQAGICDHYVKEGYRFLTFDLYGRGYSDSPDTKYTPELFVGQLTELLYALHITEKFHLLGLSMGGAISAHFTKVHPELVDKLVLISSAGIYVRSPAASKVVRVPV